MHRCLRITEILRLIIEFLAHEDFITRYEARSISSKDTARFARTCKAFMDPALDVLWRTQSSMSPLIMCLPSNLWEVELSGTTVSLLQQPSHEDWVGLKKYSHRIRAFDHCSMLPKLPMVSKSALDTIFSPSLFQELFPSLRTLNIEVLSGRPPLNPIQLLGPIRLPQLACLSFVIPLCYIFSYSGFHFVPACAPSLQALTIYAPCDSVLPEWWTPIPLVIDFRGFPYLRSLDLSFNLEVLPSSVCELIHLPYLRDLTITLPDDLDVDMHPSTQPILPSLQRLDIMVGSLNQCSSLLSVIASSELGSIEIYHRSPATQSDIYALFRAVERIHERFPDFHTLAVQCPYPAITDPSFDLSRSILTPLFVCHRLRVLRFTSFGTLDIDDAFIPQIARAWPDIEVLRLRGFQRNKAHVTLGGIRELLRGCPLLLLLLMQIDARVLPEQEPETESLSLERFDISGSRIGDESAVERYLRTLAPRMDLLTQEAWLSLTS
ncbi:hypothetical protein PISMIDRAFT_681375 [Pisolithus microcarpus 441]|uniref:F-box domain-containing protein n=1 Tax=Pisolithus microcarpus 441 TaxID=765257 RepID=A0A0C9ZG36_9AGAM|nr:hypothetical protein PISMIDRAFT_681375 [Pisolithus microcarpus 441]